MNTDARLAALESQVRTMRRIIIGLTGVLLAGGMLAMTQAHDAPKVVRAERLEIVDTNGRPVVELFASDWGGSMQFSNNKGGVVAAMGSWAWPHEDVDDGWGVMSVYDSNGGVAARVRADREGVLRIFSPDQEVVVEAGVTKDGDGWTTTRGARGKDVTRTP